LSAVILCGMETWWLFNDIARDAAWNMAVDEALLVRAAEIGRPVLRLYDWAKPAVSIGYFQKFPEDLAAQGIEVVRRPTGGGLVDHRGDVTYTVVLPPTHRIAQECPQESYNILHRCVVAALKSVGIAATLAPNQKPGSPRPNASACMTNPTRFDVMFGDRKIAGAAQRRTKTGLLHQGSIWMGDGGASREKIKAALPNGFQSVVGCSSEKFVLPAEVETAARQLMESRYAQREWNEKRELRVMDAFRFAE
jgi:lipoate-protein ligase A